MKSVAEGTQRHGRFACTVRKNVGNTKVDNRKEEEKKRGRKSLKHGGRTTRAVDVPVAPKSASLPPERKTG